MAGISLSRVYGPTPIFGGVPGAERFAKAWAPTFESETLLSGGVKPTRYPLRVSESGGPFDDLVNLLRWIAVPKTPY